MKPRALIVASLYWLAALGPTFLGLLGCSRPLPQESIIIAQTPPATAATADGTLLDSRYPPGSRIVLTKPPYESSRVRVLSSGLYAAGGPVLASDGRSVFFTAQARPTSEWQIYQVRLPGGRPRPVTSVAGGAMDPAPLNNGGIVFAAPASSKTGLAGSRPALYVQNPCEPARRITFCPGAATSPTILRDGRILFVYTPVPSSSNRGPAGGLYTVNIDGTEISAFAGQHDAPVTINRPRQLADGRIVFLTSREGDPAFETTPEVVNMSRPFQTRTKLFPSANIPMSSVESAENGSLLVCGQLASSKSKTVMIKKGELASSAQPICEDRAWNNWEAIRVSHPERTMGRLSTMDQAKSTGQVLCLDANESTYPSEASPGARVARIRILAEKQPGSICSLGEVPVQTDGSFMAQLPADTALGFEALDADGTVLRRVAPMIWARPGENRSCIGCHSAHNRAPHNRRPLAVGVPAPKLELGREPVLAKRQPRR